jgi:kynurenine formamidase
MNDWWKNATTGRIYDLEQPRLASMPVHPSHKPGYQYLLHRRHADNYRPETHGPRSSASGTIFMKEHTGTHIDAWCHQAEHLHLCGGKKVDSSMESNLGFSYGAVENIPLIVRQGWLFDVPGYRGVSDLGEEELIYRAELERMEKELDLHPGEGDVILIRVGTDLHWNHEDRYIQSAGMARDAALWAAERKAFAVGADNMSWEPNNAFDPELGTLPCHLELLARRGIYIIENLKLDELARDKIKKFLFICLPLKLMGATGSPVRPVAMI